jgi:hypothetical protein
MIEEFFFQIRIIAWKHSGAAGSAAESRTLSGAAGVRFGAAWKLVMPGSANRSDIVGDESEFARDHQPHCDPFRFVMVAAMHQVGDANGRTKAER